MRITQEQKRNIEFYLLEKIKQKKSGLSKAVAEAFNINQATVHGYINELVQEGIIERTKRGEYELIKKEYVYNLSRAAGDLDWDTLAYDICLDEHIRDLPQNVQDIWAYSFSEMVNNVMDHSMAEHLKVIVTQNYLETKTALIDDGVGIFEKIRSHFGFRTLDDAIQELFKGKLTTDTKNHSGEGIFFSSKLMDTFFIFSDGKVFTTNRYEESQISDSLTAGKGTAIVMSLSNYSMKQAKDIFDLYASVDRGFTRTRVPLKNMFESAPISRSQAKRVCNRLDQFEEVEFDFDEIPWMGQGFAHQIFVVFQNEHPAVKLIPLHMNETVEKMYRHVLAGNENGGNNTLWQD